MPYSSHDVLDRCAPPILARYAFDGELVNSRPSPATASTISMFASASVPAFTVSVVEPGSTPSTAAMITVVPAATGLATPLTDIVAVPVSDDVQITPVSILLLPSVYVPLAVI